MEAQLATTNWILGVLAVVSALEGILLIGVGVGAFKIYRRSMALVEGLEARHVVPAMARVHAVLDDVKTVSGKFREETERVEGAIRSTMDRVDDTADRVRSNVRQKTSWVIGLARGLRVAIEAVLHENSRTSHASSASHWG